MAEEARRLKAIEMSKKTTATDRLEQGEKGDLLSKYNEETDTPGMVLDQTGTFDANRNRQLADIRKKLQVR
jgi:hypothetical protein